VPSDQVESYKGAKTANFAASFWARRVAFEVAQVMPDDKRDQAERFVLRHRLSIMAAFHRRLPRADVMAAMERRSISE
jgi:hypothetical protein